MTKRSTIFLKCCLALHNILIEINTFFYFRNAKEFLTVGNLVLVHIYHKQCDGNSVMAEYIAVNQFRANVLLIMRGHDT